jgi:hypothetical protein
VNELVRIALAIGIVGYVIGRQVLGEPLRGKRVVLLPVVLTVLGAVDLSHAAGPVGARDVVLLVAGVLVAAVVGVALGLRMELGEHDGFLWGRLPVRALWWWVGLLAARLVLAGVAGMTHAHLAASGSSILLTLGVNRLAQAAVVVLRAFDAGIPFAPEKDGTSFLDGLLAPAATTPRPQGRRRGQVESLWDGSAAGIAPAAGADSDASSRNLSELSDPASA